MASKNPHVPTAVTVLLEVTVVPKEDNDSDFWDPSENLVSWAIADQVLGMEKDGWKVQTVRPSDRPIGRVYKPRRT